MGLLWGILSLQFPGLLSTTERERPFLVLSLCVHRICMLISLARSKFICSKPIPTRRSTYWPAEGCTLFTCQPTCHLQLGAACIICMQMSFGTFSCPHAFPFPYFCKAFFFFLQFILRFARLCCGLVPALGLALSHSNGGLIKHKPKSSDDDDDSCNCR